MSTQVALGTTQKVNLVGDDDSASRYVGAIHESPAIKALNNLRRTGNEYA